MPNGLKYSVTDTSTVALIPSLLNRDEIIIRNAGPGTVTLGINEVPVAGEGPYLEDGDTMTISGKKARAAIYAICPRDGVATLKVQLD